MPRLMEFCTPDEPYSHVAGLKSFEVTIGIDGIGGSGDLPF